MAGLVAVAVGAPWLAPSNPLAQSLETRLQPPSRLYPLGTDGLGRDVLSRIMHGGRIAVVVGTISVAISAIMGIGLGLLAGFYGRRTDDVIMRIVDIQQAFPPIVLAIALAGVFKPGLSTVLIILALTRWIVYARVIRAEVLSLKGRDFVEAARAIGASNRDIILHHVLPNTVNPILVVGTLEVSRMIILESSLSFLGLGIQPPTPTWGGMISDARDYLTVAWWIATFPGLAIFLGAVSVNLVGDWLRDRLDPRTKQQ